MSHDSILEAPLGSLMKGEVISIGPEDPLSSAATLMLRAGVRHLPVVAADREVVGIISERELRSRLGTGLAHLSRGGSQLQELVGNAMTPDPLTLPTDSTLEEALEIFESERVGAIVVVDGEGRLAGTLSYVDVLEYTHHQLEGPSSRRWTPAGPSGSPEEHTRELTGFDASPAEAHLGSSEPPDGQQQDLTLGVRDLEDEPESADLLPDGVELHGEQEEGPEPTAQPSERPREEKSVGDPPQDERPGFS